MAPTPVFDGSSWMRFHHTTMPKTPNAGHSMEYSQPSPSPASATVTCQ
jgi:hypothetical protein